MSAPSSPVQRGERRLRVVNCYRCNQPTGTPGAGYCDTCRPDGNPELYTDADRERLGHA